ncbi:hypothetical protein DITRI_Ditri14bG0052900 [Diplodiscus trichospermus]
MHFYYQEKKMYLHMIWKIIYLPWEMKMEEKRIEAEKQRVKQEAQQLAVIFETVGAFKVRREGGKGKQIFGSVTAQDLVDIIKAQLQRHHHQFVGSRSEKLLTSLHARMWIKELFLFQR